MVSLTCSNCGSKIDTDSCTPLAAYGDALYHPYADNPNLPCGPIAARHGYYGHTEITWVCSCKFRNAADADQCWACDQPAPPRSHNQSDSGAAS